MSDMDPDEPDIEAPDTDSAEQHQDAIPEPVANGEAAPPATSPLEANEADAAEQAQVIIPDEDEYR